MQRGRREAQVCVGVIQTNVLQAFHIRGARRVWGKNVQILSNESHDFVDLGGLRGAGDQRIHDAVRQGFMIEDPQRVHC